MTPRCTRCYERRGLFLATMTPSHRVQSHRMHQQQSWGPCGKTGCAGCCRAGKHTAAAGSSSSGPPHLGNFLPLSFGQLPVEVAGVVPVDIRVGLLVSADLKGGSVVQPYSFAQGGSGRALDGCGDTTLLRAAVFPPVPQIFCPCVWVEQHALCSSSGGSAGRVVVGSDALLVSRVGPDRRPGEGCHDRSPGMFETASAHRQYKRR